MLWLLLGFVFYLRHCLQAYQALVFFEHCSGILTLRTDWPACPITINEGKMLLECNLKTSRGLQLKCNLQMS